MSRWLSPRQRSALRQRRRWLALAALVLLLILLFLDHALFRLLYVGEERLYLLEQTQWYHMLRAPGYLPTWILIGLAMFLQSLRSSGSSLPAACRAVRDAARDLLLGRAAQVPHAPAHVLARALPARSTWTGPLVIIAAGLSGLAADIIRPIIGRLRPIHTGGTHRYHALPDNLEAAISFGLPSGHAAVAFGAAFMLLHLYPRAGAVALGAAIGCGLTRLLAGAHFVTDIFIAMLLAYAIATLVRRASGLTSPLA
jgi:membrane-associated phospholipid phosphatase